MDYNAHMLLELMVGKTLEQLGYFMGINTSRDDENCYGIIEADSFQLITQNLSLRNTIFELSNIDVANYDSYKKMLDLLD